MQTTNIKILNLGISKNFDKITRLTHNKKYYREKLFKLAPKHIINQFIVQTKQFTQLINNKTNYKLKNKYK